jgi:hypothetical protein
VRRVLQTQWDGEPAVRLDSPPGAGKTGIVERLAVQSLGILRERCMIATITNEQAFDVARRLASGYPRLEFTLFARAGLAIPGDLLGYTNLLIARTSAELPVSGPCVAIANAARWSWSDATLYEPFDLQIVDEAFQLPDYRFHQIARLGRRLVLVGDPGLDRTRRDLRNRTLGERPGRSTRGMPASAGRTPSRGDARCLARLAPPGARHRPFCPAGFLPPTRVHCTERAGRAAAARCVRRWHGPGWGDRSRRERRKSAPGRAAG